MSDGKPVVRIVKSKYEGEKCVIFETQTAIWESRLAAILIEKWGMVAACDDGEDSAGRHKLRLQTPQEVIERACTTAELAITEFRKRGWIVDLPVPSAEEVE